MYFDGEGLHTFRKNGKLNMPHIQTDQRTRKRNFTQEAKVLLFEEFKKRKTVLKPELCMQPMITKNMRDKAWREITEVLNKQDPITHRSVREVSKKWGSMIYTLKMKQRIKLIKRSNAEDAQSHDGEEEMELDGLEREIAQFLEGGQSHEEDLSAAWTEGNPDTQEALYAPCLDEPEDCKWTVQMQIEAAKESLHQAKDTTSTGGNITPTVTAVPQTITAVTPIVTPIITQTVTPTVTPVVTKTVTPIFLTSKVLTVPNVERVPKQTQEAVVPLNIKRAASAEEQEAEGLDEEDFERQKRALQIKKMKLENELLSKQLERAALEIEIMKVDLQAKRDKTQ